MASIFQFKQFAVDQTGCAMKVNTDGVLLGAMADAGSAKNLLDVGTGTGVIALMMAQRYADLSITAIEIDGSAAETAARNFKQSSFTDRLTIVHDNYTEYLQQHSFQQYDCIVSNPPFYLQSLKSPAAQLAVAKHADETFFSILVEKVAQHLSAQGLCWLILPVSTANVVKDEAERKQLYLQKQISIKSFGPDEPHRVIIALGFNQTEPQKSELTIYDSPKIYSAGYRQILKDFLIIF